MTFLQPNKENSAIITRIIAVLVLPTVIGIVALVGLHNQFVDIRHDVAEMNVEIQETRALSAEIKDQIFNLSNKEGLESLKGSQGLIQEKNPEYFQTGKQWAFAL